MRKLYRSSKKSHGFTLIELVLVMGIMVLFSAIVFGTFTIINTSHARVAVLNDAKEFAELNMQAIKNLTANADAVTITAAVTTEADYTTLYFDSTGTLIIAPYGGAPAPAFTYSQYTFNNGTGVKWVVKPTYTISASGTLDVKLEIKDNATAAKTTYYTLVDSLYLPNAVTAEMLDNASGFGTVIRYRIPSFVSAA